MALLLQDRLLPGVAELVPELEEIRHDIHAHPELGFETERTVGLICDYHRKSGIVEIDTELVKGCVIAVIEGSRPGHTIAIRADMDALPMNDGCGKPWASTIAGRGHCCGHDGHTTWLLGAARWLAAHNDFPGRIVLVHQAAEEAGTGAKALVEAGLIEKYGIEEIYGGHTEPNLPKGAPAHRLRLPAARLLFDAVQDPVPPDAGKLVPCGASQTGASGRIRRHDREHALRGRSDP